MGPLRLLPLLAVLGLLLPALPTQAVKIVVAPGKTECVADTVTDEHFTIPGGPRIDGRVLITGKSQYYVPFVTVRVLSPTGEQLWQQQHVYSEAHFNVLARGPGSYRACFYNPWESRTDASIDLVYFTLAHLRSGGGGRITIPKGTYLNRDKEMASKEHLDDVKRTILGMSEFMQVITGTQRYLQRKLDRHKLTVENNKERTMYYTLLEVGVLLAVTGTQVFLICKFFKGGKVRIMV